MGPPLRVLQGCIFGFEPIRPLAEGLNRNFALSSTASLTVFGFRLLPYGSKCLTVIYSSGY